MVARLERQLHSAIAKSFPSARNFSHAAKVSEQHCKQDSFIYAYANGLWCMENEALTQNVHSWCECAPFSNIGLDGNFDVNNLIKREKATLRVTLGILHSVCSNCERSINERKRHVKII